jgi:alpha-methylacyl-CoA racemase
MSDEVRDDQLTATGPLQGLRIIEIAGLGALPFGAMLLADMGAEVIVVQRPPNRAKGADVVVDQRKDPFLRGRRSIVLDLKHPDASAIVMRLIADADALLESFRPGVMERLGLGPEPCLRTNPRLVYGRLTGWGQTGPMAAAAGHDINYLAVSGTLSLLGRHGERPLPPLNLVADMGGGGMMLALGVACAIIRAIRTGEGQVIDASMAEGAALLSTPFYGMRASGLFPGERGTNLMDTGAPFYEVYECADGEYLAIAPVEPRFYAAFLEHAEIDVAALPDQFDASSWPAVKERFAEIFRTRTRDEWCRLMEGVDACVTPVLSPDEATAYPHNAYRGVFADVEGVVQPAPAPRFSATPSRPPTPPPHEGRDTDDILRDLGYPADKIARLRADSVIG